MRITVLTSSRADFSIYLPLLKKLEADSFFELDILAFGTHVSSFYGYSLQNILHEEFQHVQSLSSLVLGDTPASISSSMGTTTLLFSSIWEERKAQTDLIICLGDRFEMFSAVSSAIPFNIQVAHIHGGETTLGAIDNKFRHALSMLSDYHFVSAAQHAKKVAEMRGSTLGIWNVGALALDNRMDLGIHSLDEMKSLFGIDFSVPTILFTFHPETTIDPQANEDNLKQTLLALKGIDSYQVAVSMPNADTMGNHLRRLLVDFVDEYPLAFGVENFGPKGYYSALSYCALVLGNSSSGILEAASFKRHVVNLGNRQKGRVCSNNVLTVENISTEKVLQAMKLQLKKGDFEGENVYWNGGAVDKILSVLRNEIFQKLEKIPSISTN